MATESPMITPLPSAKLYTVTTAQFPSWSIKQNVLEKMHNLGDKTHEKI